MTRPGLLDECRPGVYAFAHPSLQSYVAARHLSEQPELPRLIVHLAQEDFHRWREVILFCILRLAGSGEKLEEVGGLLDALCGRPVPPSEDSANLAEWRLAWLAGEAWTEMMGQFDIPSASVTLARVRKPDWSSPQPTFA